ncbi:hypothetical protein CRD82_04405 [Escherichia coli]|uniref:hypothetical protein n=1 Tax=Escherichia coli TaxID=562 RepID=UPI000E3432D5|nr:hypothetical protein [Escherichia coli]RFQ36478.1 hypothetical protein CRD82_04405 [Escherichia coli]
MDEQIKALLNQVRILEEEANKHSGAERAELFKAAGKLKDQVATLLNQHDKGQQQPESKIPGLDYFDNKLDDAFGDYFSGDYLTPEIESYFDNLTPEQRDYFTVQVPDNVPDAPKKEPAKAEVFDDWEYRRRVLNAIGIPC